MRSSSRSRRSSFSTRVVENDDHDEYEYNTDESVGCVYTWTAFTAAAAAAET